VTRLFSQSQNGAVLKSKGHFGDSRHLDAEQKRGGLKNKREQTGRDPENQTLKRRHVFSPTYASHQEEWAGQQAIENSGRVCWGKQQRWKSTTTKREKLSWEQEKVSQQQEKKMSAASNPIDKRGHWESNRPAKGPGKTGAREDRKAPRRTINRQVLRGTTQSLLLL